MAEEKTAFSRAGGVLMHLSSMPSPYGIGVMGDESVGFAEKMRGMGFSWLQFLPLNPVGAGNSPYGSESAFGGNLLFLDPASLLEQALVSEEEVRQCRYAGSPYTADYDFARSSSARLLRKAYERGEALKPEVTAFGGEHENLREYALYCAVKEANGGRPWMQWGKYADYAFAVAHREEFLEREEFHLFCQYLFFRQYREFKKKINALGMQIIGDMPIYVSMDSADVWAHRELFQLGADFSPKKVAGVPPDYFSAEGQLWGNPLYDWAKMEEDGFRWWRGRIRSSLGLFDALRLDHFRGFASYWTVPGGAATARNGAWETGPGMKLFSLVKEDFPQAKFIAEDLGTYGEDVAQLLADTGFPGMKIIQFGFVPGEDSVHLPHHYERNSAAYCGTHDNNTLLGWLWEAAPEQRRFALDYCGYDGAEWGRGGADAPACRRVMETVWRSASALAILQFQDLCGFGSDARMNIPGVPKDNWRFRTTMETVNGIDAAYFRRLNSLFRR